MSPLVWKAGLTVALLVVGAGVAVYALHRLENPVSRFATYEQMRGSDLAQAGWIPDEIPESAFDILETHNLDTHEVKIQFLFEPGDLRLVGSLCEARKVTPEYTEYGCPSGELSLSIDGQGSYVSRSWLQQH